MDASTRRARTGIRWSTLPGLIVPLLAAGVAVGGCGDGGGGPAEPQVLRIEITPDNTLLVGVGDATTLQTTVIGTDGEPMAGVGVSWVSQEPDLVEVTTAGRATALDAGTATLVASFGGVEALARVEVWIPPVAEYLPGETYFGRNEYIEYVPGELPVVLSAPHGGRLEPAEIPDRTYGTTVTDTNTDLVIRAVRQAFIDRTGKAPHMIVSRLRRTKLDPNREIVEAAQGNAFAENAWEEFQGFIEAASESVETGYGAGLYFDLHGHGHDVPRVEIGLLLSGGSLALVDALLNDLGPASSIAALAERVEMDFVDLIRGPGSFGARLQERSIPAVPSPADPHPGGEPYFSGGYNTERHGSRDGGMIDGMQLELHFPGIRDTEPNRRAFGTAMAESVEVYMLQHYDFFTVPPATAPDASAVGGWGLAGNRAPGPPPSRPTVAVAPAGSGPLH